MMLRITGDVNADGQVNAADLNRLELAFGSALGRPGWDCECDIDEVGFVDPTDLFMLGSNCSRTA